MTKLNQTNQIAKPAFDPLKFVQHQLEHYTQRIIDARNDCERFFCRKELYNIKQAFLNYYN